MCPNQLTLVQQSVDNARLSGHRTPGAQFIAEGNHPNEPDPALAEGSSFLLLLFVAMPMKYLMGMPKVVTVAGAIHGVLFLLYVVQLVKLRTNHQWDNKFSFYAFIASILPFGPFVFDKYLRETEVATN